MPVVVCPTLTEGLRDAEYSPLGALPMANKGLKGAFAKASSSLRAWWCLTTSVAYLTCPLNRRSWRRVLLLGFACWNLCADLLFEAPLVWLSTLIFGMLTAVAMVPAQHIWWDALATAVAVVHSAMWSSFDSHRQAHELSTLVAYWMFSLTLFAGVHCVFLMAYAVVVTSCFAFSAGGFASLWTAAFGLSGAILVGVMDGRVGLLWSECDKQQSATRSLLEGLSDGGCTLDASTGTVRAPTEKLKDTFHSPDLEGQNVLDLIRVGTDRLYFEEALSEAAQEVAALPPPRLMSWQSETGDISFEAMLVPYAVSQGEISVAFRVVGEPLPAEGTPTGQDFWPLVPSTNATTANGSFVSLAMRAHNDHRRAENGKAVRGDVSFALSWADDAVQNALLAPRQASAAVRVVGWATVGVQTETEAVGATAAPMPMPPAQAQPQAQPLVGSVAGPPVGGGSLTAGAGQQGPHAPPEPPAMGQGQGQQLPSLPMLPPKRSSRSHGSRRSRGRSIGSMSSASRSRACSESSFGSSAGAIGLPNTAACFVDTALLTRRKSIIIAMHHWNLPRNPDACCPWHTAVCAVDEVARLEARTPCKPLWSPFLGWQCSTCTCVNHPTVAPCNVCGAERPSAPDHSRMMQAPMAGPPPEAAQQ